MAANEYHITTTWRVKGTVEEVRSIVGDTESLPRWWPAVYLDMEFLQPGNGDGTGRIVSVHTKGWLPYTFRWQFRVTDSSPDRLAFDAWGEFEGRGIWTFRQEGSDVVVTYDWNVRGNRRIFRWFSWLLKPIFVANHRWAMRKGEESLCLELARRRAVTADELAHIFTPPGPTPRSLGLLLLSPFVLAAAALIIAGMRRLPSDRSEIES